MGSNSSLPARMAEAARQLQEQDDAGGTMDEAVRLAVSNVDGCDAAGLSMAHRRLRQVRTDAATHDMVRLGDRL